jgi:hypothetical protein
MKTSNDLRQIEKYLFGKLSTASRLLFEAKLLIDPLLKQQLEWHRRLHTVIRLSGRRKIKAEAERVHRDLFGDPSNASFQQNIFQLFSKK